MIPLATDYDESIVAETGASSGGATPATKSYDQNDAGRATHFADDHERQIRFVPAWSRWLVWQEHYWRTDDDGAITRLAIEHSRHLIRVAAEVTDHAVRGASVRDALKMGNVQTIEKMLELARCDARIVVRHEQLDAEPYLLGVQNGVIDLRTGRFRDGRREDLITKRAGTEYVAEARCPRWVEFLTEVLDGDEALISYLQSLVGYTLTGDVSEQIFPFLFGTGKNGKSVFTGILQQLLGDYGQRASASLLVANPNGREPINEIARVHGARLVIGSETEEGARLAEARVKDLTGGDKITGRFLYAEAFDFYPVLKLWMFGNHKPEIRGCDDGIWRRVQLIPFTVQIPEARRDPHLPKKLAEELPGILQWALEGTRRWSDHGLKTPEVVTQASEEYRVDEDTLADFIDAEIELDPNAKSAPAELFLRYQRWAQSTGQRYPQSQRGLAKRLKERGFKQKAGHKGRFWAGIGLK